MFRRSLAIISALAIVGGSMALLGRGEAIGYNTSEIMVNAASSDAVSVIDSGSYNEGLYVEWKAVTNATGYNVYVDGVQIDRELIRQYSDRFRADAVGIKAGTHKVKVVPVVGNSEKEDSAYLTSFEVSAYDRSGYAFVNGSSSGAYNDDGTLKSDAVVVYVTDANKDTVSVDMITNAKKPDEKTAVVGIQPILDQIKKGTDTRPFAIRFIGNVTTPSVTDKGDLLVDGSNGKYTSGLTLEGIGTDATINGYGIRVKSISNVEIRNLGFMNCSSDETDDVGLQQDNDHVWVHNCDFFYGNAGSDADQKKGDGALDCKKSTYITFSYNHFVDNGKCNLLGLSENTNDGLYITYHHNWYDHSDSRHPRVRYYTAHVYNNYYDGNAKYGIGSTTGSSIFSENNYFRNCKYPYLTSMQGTDFTQMIAEGNKKGTLSGEDGGTIKSFGDIRIGAKAVVDYSDNNVDFDVYTVSSRKDEVPSSVKSKDSDTLVSQGYAFAKSQFVGGHTYNNFDTASDFYNYTVDNTEDVPSIVTAKAGRVQGGDIHWQFTDADDDSSVVNDELKDMLTNYTGSVVAIGSGFKSGEDMEEPTSETPTETTSESTSEPSQETTEPTSESGTVDPVEGVYIYNPTAGIRDSFYNISGSESTDKGSATFNNVTYTTCLKLESATSIEFNTSVPGKLTIILGTNTANFKLNGTKTAVNVDNAYMNAIDAGSYTITKADSNNIYYVAFEPVGGTQGQDRDKYYLYNYITDELVDTGLKSEFKKPAGQVEDAIYKMADSTGEVYIRFNQDGTFGIISALGDADGDNETGVSDIIALQRWLHGDKTLASNMTNNIDLYPDNKINIYDLALLKRFIIKNR